jgi:hypothetical protein
VRERELVDPVAAQDQLSQVAESRDTAVDGVDLLISQTQMREKCAQRLFACEA